MPNLWQTPYSHMFLTVICDNQSTTIIEEGKKSWVLSSLSYWGGEPVETTGCCSLVREMPNKSQYRWVRWSWSTVLVKRRWLKGVSLSWTAVRSNQGKGLGWGKKTTKKTLLLFCLFNTSNLAVNISSKESFLYLEISVFTFYVKLIKIHCEIKNSAETIQYVDLIVLTSFHIYVHFSKWF